MLFIIVFIVAIVAVYVTFFYHPKCNDVACWNSKLKECSRANFVKDSVDVKWSYKILGKEKIGEEVRCEVKVKAVDIKRGLKNTEILEGKEMYCYLPLGVTTAPENNPDVCIGRLKEEMQTLIIQKLHQYIVQNVGELGSDLTNVNEIIGEVEEVEPEGNQSV
jgi:hypothetical protein